MNLKPCPFCGTEPEIQSYYGNYDSNYNKKYYRINCPNKDCWCNFYENDGESEIEENIIELWNKRQTETLRFKVEKWDDIEFVTDIIK